MDSLSASDLAAWTPVRVYAGDAEPVVEWALIDEPCGDPFFEQTADRAMRHPFNELFARRTSLTELGASIASDPGMAPSGFVFHMSRCGSTLIAQMLAGMRAAVVLSEPQPIDALLRLRGHMTGPEQEEKLIGWLRALIGALGRPHAGARRLFVKFNAWHVLELPFIARAFPDVPWVFAFREPRAVLRSQARSTGAELVAGTIDPAYLGLDAPAAHAAEPNAYGARVLAAFCDAALRHADLGRALFVEHVALPGAVISGVLPFFAVTPTEGDVERMHAAARRDTKSAAGADFGSEATVQADNGAADGLAAGRLDGAYAELRARAGVLR